MDRLFEKYLRPRKIPSTACSGCGLGQVHKRILLAVERLGLGPDDVVWGTGIGCAGRQTFGAWRGDNFAGTHGRVYALATGLRVALPEDRRIVVTAGDGDAFGIGLKHLLHCARRNVGMLVVVCDNLGYQSTGGQYGPTTPLGSKTDSSPYGVDEPPWLGPDLDVLDVVKAAGATFLARHLSLDGAACVDSLARGLANPGFSLVHVIYPCVTHFGAVTLGERDPVKVMGWFRDLFAKGEPPYVSGVRHDASGSRPEFSARLRSWTRAVADRAAAEAAAADAAQAGGAAADGTASDGPASVATASGESLPKSKEASID